jgi:hypothetical protein
MPPPRTSDSFEDPNEHQKQQERKRINRFENSQYYLSPPSPQSSHDTQRLKRDIENICEEVNQKLHINPATMIELDTGMDCTVAKVECFSAQPVAKQDSMHCESDASLNISNTLTNLDDEESVCLYNHRFVEKHVSIERPFDYSLRGFGFLLSSLEANSKNYYKNLQDSSSLAVVGQNYAQIVVVEHGDHFFF